MGDAEGRDGEALGQASDPLVPRLWAQANHDLRQPLQALFFMSRSLARTLEGDKELQTLRYMAAALQGLQAKLDMLTELSRLEAGTKVPVLRPCALADVCQSVLKSVTGVAEAHQTHIRSRLSSAVVTSDATLLTLVIRSLILNAVKLANHSDILMGSRRRASRISFELCFRGSAISEALERGAFVALGPEMDGTTSEVGLGLGFIAHLGRSLDHTLDCKALPRGGVRLALSLPLAQAR